MKIRSAALATPTALVLFVAAFNAQSADIVRQEYPNAGAFCQGALPAFAGTLRTRPLAILNEGNASAFVTCSFVGGVTARSIEIVAHVVNHAAVARTVTCTLVDGFEENGTVHADYVPKSAELAAGGTANIFFTPEDLEGEQNFISNPNLSCALPAGTGIAFLGNTYLEDIGN